MTPTDELNWRYAGWRVVISSAVAAMVGFGSILIYSFGILTSRTVLVVLRKCLKEVETRDRPAAADSLQVLFGVEHGALGCASFVVAQHAGPRAADAGGGVPLFALRIERAKNTVEFRHVSDRYRELEKGAPMKTSRNFGFFSNKWMNPVGAGHAAFLDFCDLSESIGGSILATDC